MIKNEWITLFKKYKIDFGWTKNGRKGNFIELDGKDSPEEDLVNNLEYFVFEKNFKSNLNFREKCHEKK